MCSKRHIDVYSEGCAASLEVIKLIEAVVCPSYEIKIHDMCQMATADEAEKLGIYSAPTVVIDGKILKVL